MIFCSVGEKLSYNAAMGLLNAVSLFCVASPALIASRVIDGHWELSTQLISGSTTTTSYSNATGQTTTRTVQMTMLAYGNDRVTNGNKTVDTSGTVAVRAVWVDSQGRRGSAAITPPPPQTIRIQLRPLAEATVKFPYSGNGSTSCDNGWGDEILQPYSSLNGTITTYSERRTGKHIRTFNSGSGDLLVANTSFHAVATGISPNDSVSVNLMVGFGLTAVLDDRKVQVLPNNGSGVTYYAAPDIPSVVVWDGVPIPAVKRVPNPILDDEGWADLAIPDAGLISPLGPIPSGFGDYAGSAFGPAPTYASPNSFSWSSTLGDSWTLLSPTGQGPKSGLYPTNNFPNLPILSTVLKPSYWYAPTTYTSEEYNLKDSESVDNVNLKLTWPDGVDAKFTLHAKMHHDTESWNKYKEIPYDWTNFIGPYRNMQVHLQGSEPVRPGTGGRLGQVEKVRTWYTAGIDFSTQIVEAASEFETILPVSRNLSYFIKALQLITYFAGPTQETGTYNEPDSADLATSIRLGYADSGVPLELLSWKCHQMTGLRVDLYSGQLYDGQGFNRQIRGYQQEYGGRKTIYEFVKDTGGL